MAPGDSSLLNFTIARRFLSARQFGRILDGNRQAGGWMVHAELKCRPGFLEGVKGVLSSAVTYYSGDRRKRQRHTKDNGHKHQANKLHLL